MSLGIAFEGCACRATFQIGALQWLQRRGLRFAATGGSSSGAIVAAGLATDKVEALAEMWLELADTPLYHPRRLLRGRWAYRTSHVLRDALVRGFGPLRLSEVELPLVVMVTQLRRRGIVARALTQRDDLSLERALRASCFIPGPYSRMVSVGRRITFDGAWRVRTPVDPVADLGVQRVIAVIADPSGHMRRGGWKDPAPARPRAAHQILAPTEVLPIRGFDMDRERVRACLAIGARSAERFARDHEGWLGA